MQDLKQRALRGGFVKVCAQAASFVLRIGSIMILARLLDPADFGLVAMVTVITGVFNLFRDAGLSTVTIQRATITHEQLSTLFWVNMLVGVLLAGSAMALAPVLTAFYREPALFWVTVVLAVGFLLNAAGVQHSALLQREMRFEAMAAVETIALLASIGAGIGLALAGARYWALVAMTITLPCVSTIGFWVTAGWLPGLPRRGTGVRSMTRFGGTVTLNSLVVYGGYNLEKLLLGRFWGAEVLGIYGRGYQLISIPTENLNFAVGGVAVSALSRLQDEPQRFRSYFLKGYALTLVLTIPLTIFCALFADDLIYVLLGPKWNEVVPIFRYLAPTILAFALINPLYWLLVSSGHVKRSLRMAFVIAPSVALGCVAGMPFGSTGVAIGYSAAMTLLTVPLILWATHALVVSHRDIFLAVKAPFLSAGVATAAGLGAAYFWGPLLHPAPRLVMEGVLVLGSYLGTLLSIAGQKTFYVDLIQDLVKSTARKPLAVETPAVS